MVCFNTFKTILQFIGYTICFSF